MIAKEYARQMMRRERAQNADENVKMALMVSFFFFLSVCFAFWCM
jgi:hypothetical protein